MDDDVVMEVLSLVAVAAVAELVLEPGLGPELALERVAEPAVVGQSRAVVVVSSVAVAAQLVETTWAYPSRSSASGLDLGPGLDRVVVVADGVEPRRCRVAGSLAAGPDALGAVVASDQTVVDIEDVREMGVVADDY